MATVRQKRAVTGRDLEQNRATVFIFEWNDACIAPHRARDLE
jgi:hypothetical protein